MAHHTASVDELPQGFGARETAGRAAECALLGALWLLFSLPLITAGAAWLAVCEVCDDWSRGVEPPLLRTFVGSVRHRLVQGLALELLAISVVLLPVLELRIAVIAGLPGVALEATMLGLLAAGGVALVLLACCETATGGVGPGAALRAAARLWLAVPWAGAGVLLVVLVGLGLVWLMPVLGVIMGGPVGFAVMVIWLRAGRKIANLRPAPVTM
jgi:Protein of unknown function, DUF624